MSSETKTVADEQRLINDALEEVESNLTIKFGTIHHPNGTTNPRKFTAKDDVEYVKNRSKLRPTSSKPYKYDLCADEEPTGYRTTRNFYGCAAYICGETKCFWTLSSCITWIKQISKNGRSTKVIVYLWPDVAPQQKKRKADDPDSDNEDLGATFKKMKTEADQKSQQCAEEQCAEARELFLDSIREQLRAASNLVKEGQARSGETSGEKWSYDPVRHSTLQKGRAPPEVCNMIAEVQSLSTDRLAEANNRFGTEWWREWRSTYERLYPRIFGKLSEPSLHLDKEKWPMTADCICTYPAAAMKVFEYITTNQAELKNFNDWVLHAVDFTTLAEDYAENDEFIRLAPREVIVDTIQSMLFDRQEMLE